MRPHSHSAVSAVTSRFSSLIRTTSILWLIVGTFMVFSLRSKSGGEEGAATTELKAPSPLAVADPSNPRETSARPTPALDLFAPVAREFQSQGISQLVRLGPAGPECFGEDAREPPFETVLVLAQQGHSGSTSLLRLLNSMPCMNIRGENSLFGRLLGLDSFRSRAVDLEGNATRTWNSRHFREVSAETKPTIFNRVNMKRVDSLLKLMIGDTLEHVPGKITSGWKSTNLFFSQPYPESAAIVDDWIKLFPKTLIIVLTRPGVEHSNWWRLMPDPNMNHLGRQAERFSQFVAEVDAGRYRDERKFPGARVAVVPIEYSDVVNCRGVRLAGLHTALGHTFDEQFCQQIMSSSVEDYEIAMSEYDYSTTQGQNGWSYGFRLTSPLAAEQEKEFPAFGSFKPTDSLRENPQPELPSEHSAGEPFTGSPLALGPALHVPSLSPAKKRAAAACRRWKSHLAAAVIADIRVPRPVDQCDPASFPHVAYQIHLLVDGAPVLSRRFLLSGLGGEFRYELQLEKGTEVELCAVPVVSRTGKKGDGGLCGPIAATLSVLRAGTSSGVLKNQGAEL